MTASAACGPRLMDARRPWSSVRGCLVVMLLTAGSKGSACEAPSSPECFKKCVDGPEYTCEWSRNTTDGNVTFDLHLNKTMFERIQQTWYRILEDLLIQCRQVNIWVEAHVGNSSCSSPRSSVVLRNRVKYDAPQNVSMSWSQNHLRLKWKAAGKHAALAEVWSRRHGHPEDSWEKRFLNTSMSPNSANVPRSHCPDPEKETSPDYQVTMNLWRHSAHQVKIRHRSTQVTEPLWSPWSPEVTVPAELSHGPEVAMTTRHVNGTRRITLTWKLTSHAAAAAGVTFSLEDTQSSGGCPCRRTEKKRRDIRTNSFTMFVSHSPVNISVTAQNAAGRSPAAAVHVPAAPAAELKPCDRAVDNKPSQESCKQWYELQGGQLVTLRRRRRGVAPLQDYVGYRYFEHVCDGGKPRTVKTCLYYQTEGAPSGEPQDFTVFDRTYKSSNLSWRPIASEHRRGVLTHYRLCSVKMGSQDQLTECHDLSVSLTHFCLENLTPGAKYNISLAGATRAGTGPAATVTIVTLQEEHVNVWWSFGLLVGFLLASTTCTVILKRVQNKIFPPVPAPVIPEFSPSQAKSQEMVEGKEEVHKLMLLQLLPDGQQGAGGQEEEEEEEEEEGDPRVSEGGAEESAGSPAEQQRSCRGKELTDLEQLDSEIAMLIYRNGLVFDIKTDSP